MQQPAVHILGAGSIGLLSAHLLATHQPSLNVTLLQRKQNHSHKKFKLNVNINTTTETSCTSTELYIDNNNYNNNNNNNNNKENNKENNNNNNNKIYNLVITTKAHQSRSALLPLLSSSRLLPHSLYVFLQNGINIHTPLLPLLPSSSSSSCSTSSSLSSVSPQIVLGTTTHAVYRQQASQDSASICWVSSGETFFAPTKGTILNPSQISWLSSLGKIIPISELEDKLYRKLALNACINPVAALFGCTNGKILKGRDKSDKDNLPLTKANELEPWDWVKRIAREIKEVYKISHPHLEVKRLEDEVAQLATQTSNNTNSMLADLLKLQSIPPESRTKTEQYTEINFINGAIVDLGKRYNIPTPWNSEIIVQILQKCN